MPLMSLMFIGHRAAIVLQRKPFMCKVLPHVVMMHEIKGLFIYCSQLSVVNVISI